MYRFTGESGGEWKKKDKAILKVLPDGRQVVRFQPVSALATAKSMERLVTLFNRAMNEGKADQLHLFLTSSVSTHSWMGTDGLGVC
jgi:hypothetical protein